MKVNIFKKQVFYLTLNTKVTKIQDFKCNFPIYIYKLRMESFRFPMPSFYFIYLFIFIIPMPLSPTSTSWGGGWGGVGKVPIFLPFSTYSNPCSHYTIGLQSIV